MPEITIASVENRIRENAPDLDRSDIRRAAKLHKRRFDTFTRLPTHEEALLLVKATSHSDPTGEEATRNVLQGAAA